MLLTMVLEEPISSVTQDCISEVVETVWCRRGGGDKDPDIGEQMLHFQIKDCLAGIDIAVHLMRLDQPGDIISISNGLIVCLGQCHTSCIGVTVVNPAFTRAIRCQDLW